MKKIFVGCLTLLSIFLVACQENIESNTDGNFIYEWEIGSNHGNGFLDGYLVKEYLGNDSHVIIPDTFNGSAVRFLGESLFEDNVAVTEITLPKDLLSFYSDAFRNANNLLKFNLTDDGNSRYQVIDDVIYAKLDNEKLLFGYVPSGRTKDITVDARTERFSTLSLNNVKHVENIYFEDAETISYIAKLIQVLTSDYQLENIYVHPNQKDLLISLLQTVNPELVDIVKNNP